LNLRTLIEKQIEFNKDTFIALLKLEKTFDTVPWKELFKTLDEIGVDYRNRLIINNIYKEQSATKHVSDKSATAKNRKKCKLKMSTITNIIQYLYRTIYQQN